MHDQARILLIDDDEVDFVITRRLLAELSRRDYQLDWAETYEDGLLALGRQRHDVCLVDYQLGERTGLDILREAALMGCGIPMILLTGRGDSDIDQQALSLGAAGYLDKEKVDSDALDRAVRYALKREGMVNDLIDQNSELLVLHRLTEIALADESPEDAFARMSEEVSRSTGFPAVTIERFDPAQRTMTYVGVHGLPFPTAADRLEVPLEMSLSGGVVLSRRPLLEMSGSEDDTAVEALHWMWMRTLLCLPMVSEDRVVGALTLAHPEAFPVDSTQVTRVATLANHIGHLMQRLARGDAPVAPRRGTPEPLESELETVSSWFDRQARRRGMHVRRLAKTDLEGDPQTLRHSLSLLLSTALRFAEGDAVELEVRPGDDPERLVVRFDLRASSRSEHDGSEAGVALCLSTSRRLVEHLEGSYEVVPLRDGWLRVSLRAPLARIAGAR